MIEHRVAVVFFCAMYQTWWLLATGRTSGPHVPSRICESEEILSPVSDSTDIKPADLNVLIVSTSNLPMLRSVHRRAQKEFSPMAGRLDMKGLSTLKRIWESAEVTRNDYSDSIAYPFTSLDTIELSSIPLEY